MQLPRVLRPPVFDQEAKTHEAFLLHVVLWSMVVVPVPYLAHTAATDPASVERAVVQTLTGETVNLALIWLMRSGHVRWASRLQVGALWLFMTVTALTRGGVDSAAYQMGYCLVVVLAGMLLGFRVALGIALLSAASGLFMLRAEVGGLVDFGPPGPSSSIWIVSVVLFPVIAVALYLTQRTIRRALLAAHDSDLRTRTLSEASFEGLMIHDNGVIQEANQRFADIFGYDSPADLVGKRGLDFMLTPESRALILGQMAAGADIAMEVTGVRRDGSTFCGETQSRGMQYRGRSLRIVAMRDISDRIRAEQERARFEQRMAQIQKLEIAGRLAGGVAHDFNNLLMCITGNASLLQDTAELSPDQTEMLDSLLDAARSASRLTGQLLAMGRQQEVARQVLDVNHVIRGLRGVLLGLVGNGVQLEMTLSETLGPVNVDPGQVEQILVNLCINARDAMPSGGVLAIRTGGVHLAPEEHLEYPDATPGPYVRIEVSDSGAGMSPDVLGRVFEPFFTTKAPGKGTGLGLSTVYGIVRQNAGFIAVSSEVDLGSVFAVHLPRWNADATGTVRAE